LPPLVEILPHVNAGLNGLATVLLIVGFSLIKQRRETAHKWVMLACFGVSVIFLASYLTYHTLRAYQSGVAHTTFPTDAPQFARYAYYGILISHVILAALVPFLSVATIYFGLADKRSWHVRLAKITFPIWFYVSITGVIVYLMLYQIYAPRPAAPIIQRHETHDSTIVDARIPRTLPALAGHRWGLPRL